MIRDISNEIVVSLKDRLRDVRHLIRASRHGVEPVTQTLPDILFDKAARAVDKALTAAETVSISLVSQDPAAHSTTIEARGLDVYFPADTCTGEALFRRDIYYLTKRMFSVLGSNNALIHEATFSGVHGAMIRRHGALLRAAKVDGGLDDISTACAAMAIELQSHYHTEPLTLPAHYEAQPDTEAEYLCFASIALAIGLATYADHEPGEERLVESALLALQARQDKFDQAIHATDRAEAFSGLFAFLIPHLP
ncbi:hypothetical protein [Phyllobacterium sophorae]|uniref:Uncharacterized protein n=1 Tax=Phyllobacterium sophorae TaxID=1520277 RepID=A0A2P7AQ28_9HYPH|nr:hypothetical protein [Phyllobacterium sophorae]PSH56325.1 hypothetical protein CU103_30165 [Phyllobacterium sophorae]